MPLPVSVTVPAAGVRNVNVTEWRLTFAAVIATPQPATPTVVFTSTFLPFWPRIVPVSGSGAPLVFASPGAWARLTVRPAGAPTLAAVAVAVIFGAYGSASQPVAWNGAETSCVAPSDDFRVAPTAIWSQLVGLKMKFARSIETLT